MQYDNWIFQPTWELELKANLARAHALERSMRSRKKGKASLEVRTEQSTVIFHRDTDIRKDSVESVSLLEARELFIKKVNDHCAEYEAGKYGEKASNACKRVHGEHFIYI